MSGKWAKCPIWGEKGVIGWNFGCPQMNKVSLNIQYLSGVSTTKPKTFDPVWNENFVHEVHNAKNLSLTVFHDAAIPPDDFVANCNIPFEDMMQRQKEQQDFWVSVKHPAFHV